MRVWESILLNIIFPTPQYVCRRLPEYQFISIMNCYIPPSNEKCSNSYDLINSKPKPFRKRSPHTLIPLSPNSIDIPLNINPAPPTHTQTTRRDGNSCNRNPHQSCSNFHSESAPMCRHSSAFHRHLLGRPRRQCSTRITGLHSHRGTFAMKDGTRNEMERVYTASTMSYPVNAYFMAYGCTQYYANAAVQKSTPNPESPLIGNYVTWMLGVYF